MDGQFIPANCDQAKRFLCFVSTTMINNIRQNQTFIISILLYQNYFDGQLLSTKQRGVQYPLKKTGRNRKAIRIGKY
jgi:hypothetical protein